MPRKRRKSRQRLGYNSGHILQLCTGFDFFGDGFSNSDNAIKKMRKAWPLLRSEVMEMWKFRGRTGQPWGFLKFERKKTNG